MTNPKFTYPIAMILIILIAGYFLYTEYLDRPKVDLAAYQDYCTKYLQAPAGTYSKEQLESLVYKINYLYPDPSDKLAVPAERQLKHCAEQLADRLKTKK